MIIHGQYAQELLLSTLSCLPKNNLPDLCDSNNYRGIALTSCLSKVIDRVNSFHLYVHDWKRSRNIICCGDVRFIAVFETPGRHLIEWSLINSFKCFWKETYLPASSVYYLIWKVGKEIALCGKAVSLNSSRLLIGFVKVGFYHIYCLLCIWTLCLADSKVAVLVALLATNILAQCVMPMISHHWLLLSPHWNEWSKYVKNWQRIWSLMQVKPLVYTFLGNVVIVKIHPQYT